MIVEQETPPALGQVGVPGPVAPGEPVISVRGVGKMYRIYERPQDRLKQMIWRGRRQYGREFWALYDVSLDVRRGETVGVIGRNGSGKSTLLQIIAGTLQPTVGEVAVRGRVAALLELGSGFNPEFSGRENVFLNGALLGIGREQMAERFDEIAAFADIGDFIEQPVKTYSSGMFARLAFAIGIHIEPDVFIVDEALSVGDVFFQSRCARKLDEYRQRGGTLLFVTHDTYTLERICQRSLVLHRGRHAFEGPTADAVNVYYQIERGGELAPGSVEGERPEPGPQAVELRREYVTGDGSAYIESLSISDEQGRPTTTFQVGEWMHLTMQVRFERDVEQFDAGFGLRDRLGVLIGGAHSFYRQQFYESVRVGERRQVYARVQLAVTPDTYLLVAGVARTYSLQHWEEYYVLWDCCAIAVVGQKYFWGQSYLPNQIDLR
jgi:ABC-type polysaccharide/polyol phosphate transport system ATPase subunit